MILLKGHIDSILILVMVIYIERLVSITSFQQNWEDHVWDVDWVVIRSHVCCLLDVDMVFCSNINYFENNDNYDDDIGKEREATTSFTLIGFNLIEFERKGAWMFIQFT